MDYEAMTFWIERTSSVKTRQFWLKVKADDWMTRDPEAATAWLESSELRPDDWEQRLSRRQLNQERRAK